jgi:antitoxin (DNA-binding transcriptional repressor) of toxin-antitoxin stability system
MKTIGAKELRLHMNDVLDRVLAGEDIVVQHRFKGPVRIVSTRRSQPANSGIRIAKKLKTLEPQLRLHKSLLDPNKTYKELYDESLRASPKYGKYFR